MRALGSHCRVTRSGGWVEVWPGGGKDVCVESTEKGCGTEVIIKFQCVEDIQLLQEMKRLNKLEIRPIP